MNETLQRVRELKESGLTAAEIAEAMGKDPVEVEACLRRVTVERGWVPVREGERRAVLMLDGAVPTSVLADGLGRTYEGLKKFRTRMRLKGVCPHCGKGLTAQGKPTVAARESFGSVTWVERCGGCERKFLMRCEWMEMA